MIEFGKGDDFITGLSGEEGKSAVHSSETAQGVSRYESRDIRPDIIGDPFQDLVHLENAMRDVNLGEPLMTRASLIYKDRKVMGGSSQGRALTLTLRRSPRSRTCHNVVWIDFTSKVRVCKVRGRYKESSAAVFQCLSVFAVQACYI